MTDRQKIDQAKIILLMGKMAMANFNIDPKIIDDNEKEHMKENLATLMGELAMALNLNKIHHEKASKEIDVASEIFLNMIEVPN